MDHFMEDPTCRVCGCTDYDCSVCIAKTGVPCYWVDDELCSACVGAELPVRVTCNFNDATGKPQIMSFEMDLTIGIAEDTQLDAACTGALLDKSFFDYKITGITYEILKDGETKKKD